MFPSGCARFLGGFSFFVGENHRENRFLAAILLISAGALSDFFGETIILPRFVRFRGGDRIFCREIVDKFIFVRRFC